uniref:Phosphoprotein n=1 Tax=American bat vesiculovirus TaxID=1972564 RepID=A0A7T0MBX8_9RHAB|nr:phosphoprotein [American bat vesiculovirus]
MDPAKRLEHYSNIQESLSEMEKIAALDDPSSLPTDQVDHDDTHEDYLHGIPADVDPEESPQEPENIEPSEEYQVRFEGDLETFMFKFPGNLSSHQTTVLSASMDGMVDWLKKVQTFLLTYQFKPGVGILLTKSDAAANTEENINPTDVPEPSGTERDLDPMNYVDKIFYLENNKGGPPFSSTVSDLFGSREAALASLQTTKSIDLTIIEGLKKKRLFNQARVKYRMAPVWKD